MLTSSLSAPMPVLQSWRRSFGKPRRLEESCTTQCKNWKEIFGMNPYSLLLSEYRMLFRVFCRVRPPLPSDTDDGSAPPIANIAYPDTRDHKEIVLSATSESATGAERKELWNFGFDRVCQLPCTLSTCMLILLRSLSHNQLRKKFSKKFPSSHKAV